MGPADTVTCLQCEQMFVRASRGCVPKYCSPTCRSAANHARAKADGRYQERLARRARNLKAPAEMLCPYCLSVFSTVRENSPHCGVEECRKRHRAAYMRPIANRRRAAQRAPAAEAVSPLEIFIRDGWRCWLCRLPVNSQAASRSPMSASLDHVIPLSRGGLHTRRNLRCAHLRCNLSKGAKLIT